MVLRLLLALIFFCTPAFADSTDKSAEYILNRVFDGSNSLNVSGGSLVNVTSFGAVGDGSTDDTDAIQDAFDYCETNSCSVYASGTFKTTSQLTLKSDANLQGATFNVYNTPAIALQVSTADPTNSTFSLNTLQEKEIWLPKVINMTKPATGWAAQGAGVKFVQTYNCRIYINKIQGFTKGAWFTTAYTGRGNAYNNVFIRYLVNNQINLLLQPGAESGWVNQNTFYGGSLAYAAAEGTSVSGVKNIAILNYDSSTVSDVDANAFINTAIEGTAPEYSLEISGTNTQFYYPRFEGGTAIHILGSNTLVGCYNNIIIGGQPYLRRNITITKTGSLARDFVQIGSDGGDYTNANGKFEVVSVSSDTVNIVDERGFAKDVGGGVLFRGKYNTGGVITTFAKVGGVNATGTDTVRSGDMVFHTASTTGVLSEKMRLTSTAILSLDGATSTMGQLNLFGLNGGCLMFKDRDNAGYTEVTFLDGTIQSTTDADGVCDGS